MDFIYFNFYLSLVAYLKAFSFNKNTKREVCYVGSAKLFFSLFLKFPNMNSARKKKYKARSSARVGSFYVS